MIQLQLNMLAEIIVGSSFTVLWAIQVNHAAEHLLRVAILNPFEEHISFGERIISFEGAESNHDKLK